MASGKLNVNEKLPTFRDKGWSPIQHQTHQNHERKEDTQVKQKTIGMENETGSAGEEETCRVIAFVEVRRGGRGALGNTWDARGCTFCIGRGVSKPYYHSTSSSSPCHVGVSALETPAAGIIDTPRMRDHLRTHKSSTSQVSRT